METAEEKRSKLSSIFGSGSSKKLSSLKYVAPKDPQIIKPNLSQIEGDMDRLAIANTEATVADSHSEVILASPIHVFQYISGKAQPMGRMMCCIVGQKDSTTFHLLLYRSRQDQLLQINITSEFTIQVQSGIYVSFCDHKLQNWSLLFNSSSLVEFIIQFTICRALSLSANDKKLIFQDLQLGVSGSVVTEECQVTINFSCWNIKGGKKGTQVMDQKVETFTIQINDWIWGLIGCHSGGRRIIVTSTIDSSCALVYDVTVEQVSSHELELVRANHNSSENGLTENIDRISGSQFQSDGKVFSCPSKASLTSRMARVGQPVLRTNISFSAAGDSESELDESTMDQVSSIPQRISDTHLVKESRPHISAKPQIYNWSEEHMSNHAHASGYLNSEQVMPYQSLHPWRQQFTPSCLPSWSPLSNSAAAGTPSDLTVALLFTEMRSQNTELRIQLAKMEDKVDTLMAKCENIEQQSMTSPMSSVTSMTSGRLGDPQVFLTQVSFLLQENQGLKSATVEHASELQAMAESMDQLMRKNNKLLQEKSEILLSMHEKKPVSTPGINLMEYLNLKDDKIVLESQLMSLQTKLQVTEAELFEREINADKQQLEIAAMNDLLCKERRKRVDKKDIEAESMDKDIESETVKKLSKNNAELSDQLRSAVVQIVELKEQKERSQKQLFDKEKQVMALNSENESKDETIIEMNHTMKRLESLLEQNREEMATTIKKVMNSVYRKAKKSVSEDGNYSGREMCRSLMQIIRETTLTMVDEINQGFVNEKKTIKHSEQSTENDFSGEMKTRNETWNIRATAMNIKVVNEIAVEQSCDPQFEIVKSSFMKTVMSHVEDIDSTSGFVDGRIMEIPVRKLQLEENYSATQLKEELPPNLLFTVNETVTNNVKEFNSQITEVCETLQPQLPTSISMQDEENPAKNSVATISYERVDCSKTFKAEASDEKISCQQLLDESSKLSPLKTQSFETDDDIDKDFRKFDVSDKLETQKPLNVINDISTQRDLTWKPEPPPAPLFSDEEEDDNYWLFHK